MFCIISTVFVTPASLYSFKRKFGHNLANTNTNKSITNMKKQSIKRIDILSFI